MSMAAHQKAQILSQAAQVAMRSGDRSKARALYAEAAVLEAEALAGVGGNHHRTRGIIGVSLAALQYKARQYDDAESTACRLLADRSLGSRARKQLREILETVWDERELLSTGREYANEEVVVALRGGAIGSGTAPLSVAVQAQERVSALLVRLAEWKGEFEFRKQGPPPSELQDAMQLRVSAAMVGSYKFSIKLAGPAQTDLFKQPRVRPEDVTTTLLDFAVAASEGSREDIVDLIPDKNYRLASLQLLRNVAPSGRGFTEIDLVQRSTKAPPRLIRLHKGATQHFGRVLSAEQQAAEEEEEILIGVLRGLHLDRNWLALNIEDELITCSTPAEMLDDVVGPMVNNRVVVRGAWRYPHGRRVFAVRDIELSDDEMGPDGI
jgi:hypothetical protein